MIYISWVTYLADEGATSVLLICYRVNFMYFCTATCRLKFDSPPKVWLVNQALSVCSFELFLLKVNSILRLVSSNTVRKFSTGAAVGAPAKGAEAPKISLVICEI